MLASASSGFRTPGIRMHLGLRNDSEIKDHLVGPLSAHQEQLDDFDEVAVALDQPRKTDAITKPKRPAPSPKLKSKLSPKVWRGLRLSIVAFWKTSHSRTGLLGRFADSNPTRPQAL